MKSQDSQCVSLAEDLSNVETKRPSHRASFLKDDTAFDILCHGNPSLGASVQSGFLTHPIPKAICVSEINCHVLGIGCLKHRRLIMLVVVI